MITYYVVGFLFSDDLKHVALIKKARPAWQAGLLNGIGGKLEPGETSLQAMTREFYEEAGLDINDWRHFATLSENEHYKLDVYATVGDLNALKTQTEEAICVHALEDLSQLALVENTDWLISLAKSVLTNGRPNFVFVK